jgi:hypothetical protein
MSTRFIKFREKSVDKIITFFNLILLRSIRCHQVNTCNLLMGYNHLNRLTFLGAYSMIYSSIIDWVGPRNYLKIRCEGTVVWDVLLMKYCIVGSY